MAHGHHLGVVDEQVQPFAAVQYLAVQALDLVKIGQVQRDELDVRGRQLPHDGAADGLAEAQPRAAASPWSFTAAAEERLHIKDAASPARQ
jgi:hypothetical protein